MPSAQRLQTGAHARDRAVVIRALHVDRHREAALPLRDVIGDIGHEVGIRAVRLAHDTILVVAVVGRAQPQCTVPFERLAGGNQALHGLADAAARIQARLEEISVEAHTEGAQVEILLMTQVRDRELADAVEVIGIAARGVFTVVGPDGLPLQEVGRDVGDVLAVVRGLRPAGTAWLQPLHARLRRQRKIGDLDARVVVVELAVDLPALRLEQVADGVAERSVAAVTYVQRPGRVGGDEFDDHTAAAARLATEAFPSGDDLGHDRLPRRRLQREIDEAGPGDLHRLHPALYRRLALQRLDQCRGDFARIALQRLGQLHRHGAGQVAMRGVARRFEVGGQ